MAKAILFDGTKCTACRGCQVACKQWNELKAEETTNRGTFENPPDLSSDTWLKIKFTEVSKNGNGGIDWLFTRRSCMHCTDAACVTVCPSGALSYHKLGFVQYNKDKCTGCGYCVEACPFKVPKSDGGNFTGVRKASKCLFCQDRVTNGFEPACVTTCPTAALQFGERSEMVAIGRSRVEQLGSTYPMANLYGEKQLDGLHVLYVLPYAPEVHGLPADPKVPTAAEARDILKYVGVGAVAAVAVGAGLNFLVARARMIEANKKGGKG
ncbi:MAG: 4Fe-4S dicluster domain-containing protein [Dehalococcoidia bacterium]|nr:4Fe-4S dicluster domain-containing protein [Dehalococcoidia bacterium]